MKEGAGCERPCCAGRLIHGKRHMVRRVGHEAWECVDCQQTFDHWPSDHEMCSALDARSEVRADRSG